MHISVKQYRYQGREIPGVCLQHDGNLSCKNSLDLLYYKEHAECFQTLMQLILYQSERCQCLSLMADGILHFSVSYKQFAWNIIYINFLS